MDPGLKGDAWVEFQNPNSLAVLSCTGDSPWTVFPVSRTKAQAWLLLGVGLKYIKGSGVVLAGVSFDFLVLRRV